VSHGLLVYLAILISYNVGDRGNGVKKIAHGGTLAVSQIYLNANASLKTYYYTNTPSITEIKPT